MKNKISTKIISAIIIGLLFIASVFVPAGNTVAFADAPAYNVESNAYFTYGENKEKVSSFLTENGSEKVLRVAPVDKADATTKTVTVDFKQKLAVNDFETQFIISEKVEKLTVKLVIASFYSFGEDVKVNVTYTKNGANYDVKVNDVDIASTAKEVTLSTSVVAENLFVDGTLVPNALVENTDKTPASISLEIKYSDLTDENAGVDFVYIDQKASNGATDNIFRQTFNVNDTRTGLKDTAKRVVDIDEEGSKVKLSGNEIYLLKDTEYTLKVNSYGLENVTLSPVLKYAGTYANINSGARKIVVKDTNADGEKISFGDSGEYGEYTIKVVDGAVVSPKTESGIDETIKETYAPKPNATSEVKAKYQEAVEKASKKEYEVDGQKQELSIRVGSGQYYNIPSQKSIIDSGDFAYSSLKYTVYYMNVDKATEYSTATSMSIPVTDAGTYKFFIVYETELGNALDVTDFYDKEHYGETGYETYKDYIFTFSVEDNAPTSVKGVAQTTWYKGVTNTAKSFKIESSSYTTDYKLYFEEANGTRHEIVKYDESTISSYQGDYFTAEEIVAFKYDGSLTFTPQRAGKYVIECSAQQTSSAKVTTGETTITVKEVKTVTPDDHWFENNLWSFIFLGVGTLALAGIIVLLFIKPKDKEEI